MSPTNTAKFLTATNTKPKTTTAPRFKLNVLADKPDENEAILIYGPQGSGKTHCIVEMLRAGERVFLLSTDMGGSGASTVVNVLREENPDLLKNILEVTLTTYEEVEAFLADVPQEVWEFNPTVLVWDGFSNFQTNLVLDKVGDMTDHKKETSSARDEGAAFDQQDWGIVKRLSNRAALAFLALRNNITKLFPVRVLTCWQEVMQKTQDGKLTITPLKRPMLVGATKHGLGAAFGLCILTKLTRDEKGNRKFSYITEGHEVGFDKQRVKNLKPEEDSFLTIWKEVVRNRKTTN